MPGGYEILPREVMDRLDRPTGEAGGLPAAAYTSPAFLARENERLFARRWVCVGITEDVPAPGSVRPRATAIIAAAAATLPKPQSTVSPRVASMAFTASG